MDDNKKTKPQLLKELADLRRQLSHKESFQKAFQESENKYRATVNSIEEGYYEVDLTGKYTFVNPAAGKFLGRSPDELIGTRYSDYTTPETAKRILQIYNEIYQTGLPSKIFVYQIISKDGKIRELEISASLIQNAEGNPIGFRGIGWDATERKKMEAEQERYRNFFENATDACFEVDLRGAITFVNEAACRIFGFSREEFMGMNNRAYTTPETAKRVYAIYNEIYRTGLPSKVFEYEIIHKGKEIRTLETAASLIRDSKGNPVGFQGITRDITERKKMQAEQERYKDFLENASDACFEVDLRGSITYVNEAACLMFGYTREKFIGMNNRDYTSPETAKRIYAIYNEVYRTGQPSKVFEYETIRKDREIRNVESAVSLIRDQAGNPIGFRGITRDVTERKKIEKEQERYRDFIENIDDVCVETDLEGKVIFTNNVLPRMTGYTPEEFDQLKREERYATPEEARRTFQIYTDIYRKGKRGERFYANHRTKEGKILTLEVSASLVRDAEGNPVGFRGIGRDVTERKKMEAEQARYRNFFENIEDGCWENDLAGNMTFFNDAVFRTMGYSREEYMGMNNRDYTSPETAKKIFKMYNEIYRTGQPITLMDYEVFHKNGKIINLEMSTSLIRDPEGNPIGFRGVSRDVTERKMMETEKERYRDFVENIADGCWETDLAGNMTFANEAAGRTLGYTREEFLSLNFRDFTVPEKIEETFKIFLQVYQTGIPFTLFNQELKRKDGEIIHLDMSASLIRDPEGNPIGFRGVSRDVTGRKKLEAETIRLTEQLNQARKLEAIGTLAGGIAHEFNNILMGIQGYASLMLLDIDSSHPFYEKLMAIEAQVISAADLTGQLLGYARGGRYEVKPTNLNKLISKTASMFGRTKKEIIIRQTLDKTLWKVDADQGQFEQVLMNLFMNAWQAMPAGGSIYLQTENVMLDESYVKSYETQPGPFVKISVTDTGMGMDVNTKERIFEPFFTTKEMGRGAGLGLASAYGIIRGHGGMINVYSEKGYGTTFNIYLPASKKEAIPEKLPARETINRGKTILLVDDEKTITDVTGAMINRLGYQLLTAHNGEEAVEIYQANPSRIDLVILDMIMPGIGGGKALDFIQSINPKAMIILSSGFSLNGEAKEIMNRGAMAFLQKPFLIDDLSRVIREVLESP